MKCFYFFLSLLLPFVVSFEPEEYQELLDSFSGFVIEDREGHFWHLNAEGLLTTGSANPNIDFEFPVLGQATKPIWRTREELKKQGISGLSKRKYFVTLYPEFELSVGLIEYLTKVSLKFKMLLKKMQSRHKKCHRVYAQIESGNEAGFRRACLLGCYKYQDYDECVEEFFGFQFMTKDILNGAKKFFTTLGQTNYTDDGTVPDSEAFEQGKENVYDLLFHIWPVILSWIPLVLVQYKKYNSGVAAFLLMIMLPIALTVEESRSLWLVNVLVTFLCIFLPSDSPEISEIGSASALTGLVLLSGLVLDKYQQLAVLATVIAIYLSYLGFLWRKKKTGSQVGVMMLILQVIVLHEESIYIREMFQRDLLHYGIESILFTIVPQGRYQFMIQNSARLATIMANFLASYPSKQGIYTLFLFGILNVMFLVSRVIFGGMMLTSIKWRLDSVSYWDAFMTYCTGMLAPWKILLAIIPGGNTNLRKLTYAIFAGVLQWYEFKYCLEFFVLRMVLSMWDCVFLNGHYGDQTRMLCDNVVHCNQKFVQYGALPRYRSDQIDAIKAKTVKLFCDTGRAGAGFLRRGKDGDGQLITVQHVIDGAKKIDVLNNGKVEALLSVKAKSLYGHDPVQVIDFACDGVSIPVLRHNEILNAKMLMTFTPTLEDGVIDVHTITDFTFDDKGKINVCASYIKGESGSPVIAFTDDYAMRFAGVVSAGRTDEYAGNICSSVIMDDSLLNISPPRSPSRSPPRDSIVLTDIEPKTTRLRAHDALYSNLCDLYELAKESKRVKKKGFIVVDPQSEEGWNYQEDDYDPDSDKDLEIDSEDEDEVKEKKGKERQARKKRFDNRQHRKRGDYNRRRDQLFSVIESLTRVVYGDSQAQSLVRYLKRNGPLDVKSRLCTLQINSDDSVIVDDTPDWHHD